MGMDAFERTMTHYLRAPFVLSQAAIPAMRRTGAGWIVNLGSQDALPVARPYGKHEKTRWNWEEYGFESFPDLLNKVDHVEIANDSMRMQAGASSQS